MTAFHNPVLVAADHYGHPLATAIPRRICDLKLLNSFSLFSSRFSRLIFFCILCFFSPLPPKPLEENDIFYPYGYYSFFYGERNLVHPIPQISDCRVATLFTLYPNVTRNHHAGIENGRTVLTYLT